MPIKKLIYFAHPFESKDSIEEKIIIAKLEKKGFEVMNPFDGEDTLMLKKYHRDNYYPNPPLDLGLDIWNKDLRQVNNCDIIFLYIPKGMRMTGGCGFELAEALRANKEIVIVSESKHPAFAYCIKYSTNKVTMYESIEDWIRGEKFEWI